MGKACRLRPKCLTEITAGQTILSRQLQQLAHTGICEVVITTGPFADLLQDECRSLELPLHLTFVHNPVYQDTNYIYSIYCARQLLDDDILMLHGDLVLEQGVLDAVATSRESCMAISSTQPLVQKDFHAVVQNGRVTNIGTDCFDGTVAAQPLYKLYRDSWKPWLDQIVRDCENGDVTCYAEHAFNKISDQCGIRPLDIRNLLCGEVDCEKDLEKIRSQLAASTQRTVYMCFATDMIHSGHIAIIKKAARLGKLVAGVLTDEAVAGYRRFPLMPFAERKAVLENITGVGGVVCQETLSYKENLEKYRPDYVVHGDDWADGFQKPVREEVLSVLAGYGGMLVEYPYAGGERYAQLERRTRAELSLPDVRRAGLKKLLALKGMITALEAHSGITGLLVERTAVYEEGRVRQFDAVWVSSLCDSTAKGKPDIELVDMTSRFRTIDDIMEVTTKPVIFDGDTGGLTEHFVYTVKTLERMGVSMIIIEDKTGLKQNSLFGTEVEQTQDTVAHMAAKIAAGKKAQKTKDFMICARIESLILEQGMEDALLRADAYVRAGADAIMIHSRKKDPDEVFVFLEKFRCRNRTTPVVVVPTAFASVTEEQLRERGANVVIYANQLTRAGFPAMQKAARTILKNHRAKECDAMCMPIREILTLIPQDGF